MTFFQAVEEAERRADADGKRYCVIWREDEWTVVAERELMAQAPFFRETAHWWTTRKAVKV